MGISGFQIISISNLLFECNFCLTLNKNINNYIKLDVLKILVKMRVKGVTCFSYIEIESFAHVYGENITSYTI